MDTYFNPSVLESAIQEYVKAHITGGLCAVSEANLDEDRPDASVPFVTWNLISGATSDEELYEISRTYNSETKTVDILNENYPTIILSINCSHKTRDIAYQLAILCRTWFQRIGQATLSANNAVYVDATPSTNRTTYIVKDYMYMFGFDVTLRTKQTLTETIEAIETVETTLNGETEVIDLSEGE